MGTVLQKVGKVVRCRTVIRARGSPRDLDKAYFRGDDYTQAEVPGHRAGRAGDRVPGFGNTDNQLACSPLGQEAGSGAVVDPDAEEAEGKTWED